MYKNKKKLSVLGSQNNNHNNSWDVFEIYDGNKYKTSLKKLHYVNSDFRNLTNYKLKNWITNYTIRSLKLIGLVLYKNSDHNDYWDNTVVFIMF